MFINALMIIISTVSLFLIYDYLRLEKINTRVKCYILTLGIFVFIWVFSYALMGITENFAYAAVFRCIGLIGACGFVNAEMFFITGQCFSERKMNIIVHLIYTVYSLSDILIFGVYGMDSYLRVFDRTSYVVGNSMQALYHGIYIIIMSIGMFLIWCRWRRTASFKREKRYFNMIMISNLAMLAGCIPDIVFPFLNIPFLPTSAVGGFVTYCALRYFVRQQSAFEISTKKLRNYIYENVNIGVLAFYPDQHLGEANVYAQKLLGIESADKSIRLSELFRLTTFEEKTIFEEVLNGNDMELKTVTRAAQTSVKLILHMEKDENGYPYAVYVTVVDETHEDEMIAELSAANEAKSEFLSGMSHEIRTPVNTIMGMDEMILRTSIEPRIRGYAQSIKSSCKLLITIINDILDFSKIESGEVVLSKSEYSLRTLISDIVAMLQEWTDKKGLQMEIAVDKNLPEELYGDEMRIRQIAANLLSNAVKYTDHGTVKLEISGSGYIGGNVQLRIDVSDTGRGIKEDDRMKLFGKFSRLDERKNRYISGTGLGLSIVSHFVALMEGTINVESEYGKGSVFSVLIPQKVASDKKIGDFEIRYAVLENEEENDEIAVFEGKRVLIVDDNEMNLNVAALLFEKTRMKVDISLNGENGLNLMRENKYDLILLDHMMPVMDGIMVLKAMKSERLQTDVPVIVLTANAVAGAKEMYLKEGFDDYLSKPLLITELNALLNKYLSESSAGKVKVRT